MKNFPPGAAMIAMLDRLTLQVELPVLLLRNLEFMMTKATFEVNGDVV